MRRIARILVHLLITAAFIGGIILTVALTVGCDEKRVRIFNTYTDGPINPTDPAYCGDGRVYVCHKNKVTLCLPQPAAEAHLAKGDTLGMCIGPQPVILDDGAPFDHDTEENQ